MRYLLSHWCQLTAPMSATAHTGYRHKTVIRAQVQPLCSSWLISAEQLFPSCRWLSGAPQLLPWCLQHFLQVLNRSPSAVVAGTTSEPTNTLQVQLRLALHQILPK